MADQVHQFKGVRYVPIKAIRDSDRKWLSAGWLSKQMTLNNYNKTFLHQLTPISPIFPHFPPFFLSEREVERVTEVPP